MWERRVREIESIVSSVMSKIIVILLITEDTMFSIILPENHEDEMQKLKELLAAQFEIKDKEPLKYFIGMKTAKSKEGISVSQKEIYPQSTQ